MSIQSDIQNHPLILIPRLGCHSTGEQLASDVGNAEPERPLTQLLWDVGARHQRGVGCHTTEDGGWESFHLTAFGKVRVYTAPGGAYTLTHLASEPPPEPPDMPILSAPDCLFN